MLNDMYGDNTVKLFLIANVISPSLYNKISKSTRIGNRLRRVIRPYSSSEIGLRFIQKVAIPTSNFE